MQEVVLCRHCDTRVVVSEDRCCPSCGEDVNQAPSIERKRISREEEEKLLQRFQNYRSGRKLIVIVFAVVLLNTVMRSFRSESSGFTELIGGLLFAALLVIACIYLTRKMNDLSEHMKTVTTNK